MEEPEEPLDECLTFLLETDLAALREYRDQAWLEAHPSVYIVTDGKLLRYDIFSAYEASAVSDTYRLCVKDEAVKQAAPEHFTESSVPESPPVPTTEDQVLTLSARTGTYHTRWVVQAVLTAR